MNKNTKENQRIAEFLACLGNGRTIFQCELDNDEIDEVEEEWKTNKY